MFARIFNYVRVKIKNWAGLQIVSLPSLRISTEISTYSSGRIHLGRSFSASTNTHIVSVGGQIDVGECVSINRNSIIVSRERITIGSFCSIGPNVAIYDHDHIFNSNGFEQEKYSAKEVSIGDNTWIGAGVIILKGASIGKHCVIGAGAIVKGTVPDNSILTIEQNQHIHKIM